MCQDHCAWHRDSLGWLSSNGRAKCSIIRTVCGTRSAERTVPARYGSSLFPSYLVVAAFVVVFKLDQSLGGDVLE